MISIVIYINNWIYEQYLEKRDINTSIVISKRSKQEESQTLEYYKNYNL